MATGPVLGAVAAVPRPSESGPGAARGVGIGRKLLEAIEAYALAAGLLVLRLETGIAQPGAVRLYERAGYSVCEPFGAFAPQPTSIYMEKRLDAGRRQPG